MGENLPDDGDYDFKPVNEASIITDIEEVHEIAGRITRGDDSW